MRLPYTFLSVIGAVLAMYFLGSLLGFQVSLLWSLIGSLVLTLLLNLVLGGFRRRRG